METLSKILALNEFLEKSDILRNTGKRLVFTNGCFDILHAGHVRYLQAAKIEGDILLVGLNSDQSVRKIKGAKRPLIRQEQRAEILAALACIDYIILFDEVDPLNLIEAIGPDILVKGSDWDEKDIIGAESVKKTGGRVVRVPVIPEISTSLIIEKIIKSFC
jgi:D-beta-D-heptose 7-phosphate kinase/D-beta-D-heptose 1-phosphate adenosyltransferase